MKINEIKLFLYNSGSEDQAIHSFLNFLYTNVDDFTKLSAEFLNAFENAYKKENINAILNRKTNKRNINKDIKEIIDLENSKVFKTQIYKVIIAGTTEITEAHKLYLDTLINSKPIKPIKYIIIGEAPPFSLKKKLNKSKLELIFENNYILSKKNAGSWQSSIRRAFDIAEEEKGNTPDKFIEGLVANNILFFDIIPVTLPFSTDIRTAWIDKRKAINKKPLLVSLLELAIKSNVKGLTIDPNVKVAFVTPPKTSISIFDYYSDKKLKITNQISVDITIINDNTTKSKYGVSPDIILPMYKANAMMGSNTPSVDLIKLALDL